MLSMFMDVVNILEEEEYVVECSRECLQVTLGRFGVISNPDLVI